MIRTDSVRDRDDDLEKDLAAVAGCDMVRFSSEHPKVVIARVSNTEMVKEVVRLTGERGLPLLPRAPGLDLSSIESPADGGVVLDLSPMNRVLEIEHSRRCAVVEPGVTWRLLDHRLKEEGADLACPFSAAPPSTGPWTSCLVDGAEGASLGLGDVGRSLSGVEAVLPSGEVVHTGARSASGAWWGLGLHPDLTSLFARWRGSTGIVTRLSVCLNRRPRHSRRLLLPCSVRRAAIAASIRLARARLFDEAHVFSWTLMRLLLGGEQPGARLAGEPEAWLAVDFSADSLPEIEYKRVRLAQALSRATRRGGSFDDPLPLRTLVRVEPSLEALEDLPMALPLAAARAGAAGKRLAVLGLHGPVSRLVDAAEAADHAYTSRNLPAVILCRPVPGGHFGTIHVVLAHAAGEPAGEAAADAMARLCGAGFVPHRFPPGFSRPASTRLEPEAPLLAESLRAMLDPDGLLDPGRWGLPRPCQEPSGPLRGSRF